LFAVFCLEGGAEQFAGTRQVFQARVEMGADLIAEFRLENLLDFAVLLSQQPLVAHEERRFHADCSEERGHLAADDPAADDDEALGGRAAKGEKMVAGPYRQIGEGRWHRAGAGGDDDFFRGQRAAGNLDPLVANETSLATDERDPGGFHAAFVA